MGGFGKDPIPGLIGGPISAPSPAAPQDSTPVLRVVNGPCAGRTFSLAGNTDPLRIRIGRSDPPAVIVDIDLTECELGAPAMVSRLHAELLWIEGALHLVDMGSRNGTWIDGVLLAPVDGGPSKAVALTPGSKIRLANLLLEVALPVQASIHA